MANNTRTGAYLLTSEQLEEVKEVLLYDIKREYGITDEDTAKNLLDDMIWLMDGDDAEVVGCLIQKWWTGEPYEQHGYCGLCDYFGYDIEEGRI